MVTPAGKLFRPAPGEGREAPGSGVLGESGAGPVAARMWDDEEGALMLGSDSGGAGGACPDSPLGLKVCCWPAAREGPAPPAVCLESALTGGWGTFQPRPVLRLALGFLLFFRSLCG